MNRMPIEEGSRREVYFEFAVVGAAVRVAAIDAETGIEVTVMGPASAAQSDLQKLALAKLKARLARDNRQIR
jgi:hypothetical protein